MAPANVGILAYAYQVVDAAGPTDLLASARKPVLENLRQYIPINADAIAHAPDFQFHYVGVTKDPIKLGSSNLTIVPTTTVDECPELDILLVPGPYLGSFELHPKHGDLIRRHDAAGKLIFTTCTGASIVASTGVLDGRSATVNNVEYQWVKKRWPKVHWTRDRKWVVDGNIWTGSGAYAGTDMVAHWLKETYGLDVLVEAALSLEYEPRDINGLFTVFPQRFDEEGKKLSTHLFKYYEE